jgi:hypothetical protein
MEADPCIIYIREVVIVVNCVKKTQYQLVALYVDDDLIIAAPTKNIIPDLEGYSGVVSRHAYHCDKVARMTQHDARAEVHLLTATALQNCTASSTNKTHSSAWTAGFGYRKCISILLIAWTLLHNALYHWRQYKRQSSKTYPLAIRSVHVIAQIYTETYIPGIMKKRRKTKS